MTHTVTNSLNKIEQNVNKNDSISKLRQGIQCVNFRPHKPKAGSGGCFRQTSTTMNHDKQQGCCTWTLLISS
jgi:hypothetical protein